MRKLPPTPAASVPARRRAIRRILTGSIAAVAALSSQSSPAATIAGTGWTGVTDGLWSTNSNWDSSPPSADERNLFFGQGWKNAGGTGATTANNDLVGYSGYRITFEDINGGGATDDQSFTITGNGFTLFDFGGGAFPKIENQSYVTQTFNLSAAQTIVLSGGGNNKAEINAVNGDLVFSGTTAIDLAGSTELQVWGNNGKTITFNGAISSSGNSGNNGFSLNQNSTVIFGAANTYAGNTVLDAGTLRLAAGGSVTSSDILVGTGATFDVNGQTATVKSISEQGGSDGGSIKLGSGSLTVNNAGGGTKYFNNLGVAGDTGSFTLNSAGSTLELYGASAYTGTTTVQNGTLNLQATATLASGAIVVSGGTLNPGGSNLLGDSASVTVSSGTLAFGANSDTVGAVALQGGAISSSSGVLTGSSYAVENGTLSASIAGSGTLTKSTGGTVTLSGSNTGYTGLVLVNGGTLRLSSAGTNAAIPTDGNAGTSGDIVINGGTLQIAASEQIGDNGSITLSTGAFNFSGSGRTETIGKFTNSGGTFTTGANTLIGTGASITWSGGTNTIGAGGLVQDGHWLVTGGTNTVDATGTLEVLTGGAGFEFGDVNSPNVTVNGTLKLTGNLSVLGTLTTGTASLTGTGTIDLDAGTRTFTVNDGTNATDLSISAIIANGALTKSGAGTLVLSGPNTYAGVTSITNGTLQISAANHLGDSSSATNTISLSGGGILKSTASVDLGVNRAIAMGAGGGTLSTGPTNATTLTVSGALSGSDTLTTTGGGTFILSADNSGFSGNVNVDSAGGTANSILRLSHNNALTSGTVTLAQGTVAGGVGTSLDIAGVSIGSGVSLVLNSNLGSNFRSALTSSTGTAVWAGPVTLNGDNFDQFYANGTSFTVSGNVGGGGFTGFLVLRGSNAGTVSGTITLPAASVTKTDGSTWTLSGTGNSWLNTTVAVGTLKVGSATAVPSTTGLTMGQADAAAAILDLNGFDQTIASLALGAGTTGTKTITNSGGTVKNFTVNNTGTNTYGAAGIITGNIALIKDNTGSLSLGGANTYVGLTTVNAGTLSAASATALGTTAAGTTVVSGATLDINGVAIGAEAVTLTGVGAGGVGALTGTGTGSLAGAITLGGATTVGGAGTLTLSGVFDAAGTSALTKVGAGTIILTTASTRTGTTDASGGTLQITNLGALGSGTITANATGTFQTNAAGALNQNVVLNGGTFSHLPTGTLTLGAINTITVNNVAGNVIDVTFAAPSGKINLTTAGQLTGSGNFTKTGAGDLQIGVANTGFTGAPTVNGGILEIQNLQALGTVQPTITVGGTGEIVMSNLAWAGPITANTGGALSGNSGNSTYSGAIAANGNFFARARDFQGTTTARTLTLSGPITGSGRLTAQGPSATNTGRVLITANNPAWTGALQVDPLTQAVVSVGIGAGATTSLPTGDLTLNGGRLTITPSIGTGLTTTAGIAGRWITNLNTLTNTFAAPWFTNPTAATRADATINSPNLAGIDPITGLPGGYAGFNSLPQGAGLAPNVAGSAFVEGYSVAYNGLFNITTGGSYTFTMPSDDGSSLFIDGQQVIVNEGPHGTTTVGTGTVTLATGPHQITVKNTNGGTGGGLQVGYQGPDQAVAPTLGTIPGTNNTSGITNMATVGLPALTNVTGGLSYALSNTITLPAQASATTSILETSGFDTTSSGAISAGTNANLVFASATSHTFTQNGTVTLAAGAGLSSAGTAVTVPISTTLAPANVIVNGAVTLTGNANLNADGGTLNSPIGLLTINGVIDDGAGTFSLTKTSGGGTVVLGGTAANTFDGAFNMAQGVLLLNKTAGLNAIGAGGLNLSSNTTGTGVIDYAVVRLLASEQIANASTLNVIANAAANGFGVTLDLNNFTETVGAVNLSSATTFMARIVTGPTGTLAVGGDITFTNNRNSTGNTNREAVITGVAAASNSLSLFAPGSGTLNLGGARNITVSTTVTQADTGGTIDSIIVNGGITKLGGQRLVLNGSDPANARNSTFSGGIALTNGILRGGGMGAQTDSAFGTGTLTINKGLTTLDLGVAAGLATLELRNNTAGVNYLVGGTLGANFVGQSVNNVVNYGNAVTVANTVPIFGVDVNNYSQIVTNSAGATLATLVGSGGELRLGTLTTTAALQLNVTGGNNYALGFNGLALGGALSVNAIGANLRLNNLSGAQNITTLATNTGNLIIGGTAAGFTGNVNVSAGGTLRLAPTIGVANNLFGGGTFTTAANPTIGISPSAAGATLTAGTPGGLTAKFYNSAFNFNHGSAQGVNSGVFYAGPSGVMTVPLVSDGAITNRPPTVTNTSHANAAVVYTGLLNITAGGSYTFQTFVDDESQLVIDGMPLISTNTGGGGTGIIHSPVSGAITLSAGLHTITMKVVNNGGGGGVGLSYNGTDSGGVMRPIPSTALQSVAPLTNVANTGTNHTIAAAGSLTLDGGGTDLDGGINNLTFGGATGTLNVTNAGGIGVITVSGTTDLGTGTVTLNPTSGVLGLIGAVNNSAAITKNGVGTLILAGAKGFTGALTINSGVVQVTDPLSLGTAAGNTVTTTVAPTLSSTTNVTSGTANSVTVGSTATLFPGQFVSGTGIPAGSYIAAINSATTYTLSQNATVAATNTLTYTSGTTLDLNGTALGAEPLSLIGGGTAITPAALYNSASGAASASGPITLTGAATVGGFGDIALTGAITGAFNLTKIGPGTLTVTNANNTGTISVGVLSGIQGGFLKQSVAGAIGANVTSITTNAGGVFDLTGFSIARNFNLTGSGTSNYGTMNSLGTLVNTGASGAVISGTVTLGGASSIGSSSLGAGGDFTISTAIAGGQGLTKVGGNTVTLTGASTAPTSTTVNLGTLTLSGGGTMTGGGLTANPTSIVNFDYSTAAALKLGAARSINLVGGNLNMTGNASNVIEALTTGVLTTTSNNSVWTLTPAAGALQLTSTAALVRGFNGTALFRGTNLGVNAAATGGAANIVPLSIPTIGQAGVPGATNRAVAPWALADTSATGVGTSFAGFVAGNGIQVLGATDYATANTIPLMTASATSVANLLLNAGATTTALPGLNMSNSLTMDAAATLSIGAGNSVLLDSGGILARTGTTSTISGAGTINGLNLPFTAYQFIPTLGNSAGTTQREIIVQTPGSALLNVNVAIGNSNPQLNGANLTKAGAGDLSLNTQNFFTGSVRINGGRIILASGQENTLLFPVTTPPVPGTLAGALSAGLGNIVGNAGTLDLFGKDQRVGGLGSNLAAGSSLLPNTGGIITNSVAGALNTATLRVTQGATFPVSTALQGNLNFQRDGGNTLTMTSPNTYTGTTVINGGLTVLQDGATFGSTSSITINRAVLRQDEAQTLTVANRLPTTVPITLNGGALSFVGRGGGTQNVWNVGTGVGGSVTIGLGNALFQTTMAGNANANGAGQAQVNIGNLIRGGAGSQLSFNFVQSGNQSVGDNPRYSIAQLNGGALPAAGTMLPAWITIGGYNPASAAGGTSGTVNNSANNTTDFAQYDPTTGLRPLFYTSTVVAGVNPANTNVNVGSTTTLPVGGAVVNSLRIEGASTLIFGDAGYDVLNLQSGGLMSAFNANVNAKTIGITPNAGNITAGGVNPGAAQELFIYGSGQGFTINARLINNPTDGSVVSPVFGSGSLGGTITLQGSNTYTGTTYVNGVNLTLNNTVGGLAIPGNLVASGGTSNGADSQAPGSQTITLSASNQIAPTATVTLNGGTALNLNNNSNTLANLVFAADGGSNNNQGPGVSTGTGTLTLTGNITATILNQATTIPSLQGNLALPAGAHTINVGTVLGAPGQIGFQFNPTLTGTGDITKTGAGILGLATISPAFAGTLAVSTGSVQFTQHLATTAYTLNTPILLTAPVNLAATGTLNAGGFVGSVGALSGTGTVTNSINSILVNTSQIINNQTVIPQVNVGAGGGSASFGGLITSNVIFGKVGAGNQTLTNAASTYTGGTVINGGTLTLGGGAGVNVTGTSLLSVNNTGNLAGIGAITGGLQFNHGSSAAFVLGALPGPAPFTTPASVNSAGQATFNITGTPTAGTTYPLIDYSGAAILANQMAGFKLGTTPGGAGLLYGLVNNAAGTSIDLIVESVNASKIWSGTLGGTWDTVTNNFSVLTNYNENEQVVFTNAGLVKTITGTARTPQAITITNSGLCNDYSIANAIGGALAGGLTKNDSGLVLLTGNNTFTGPITVNGGTVRANVTSTSNSLGSGSVSLAAGTTLTLDPTANTGTSGLTGRIVTGGVNSAGNTTSNFYGQPSVFTGTFFTGGTNLITGGTAPFYPNGVLNNFGAQFTGKIKIDVAGPYSFTPRSDDGSRVFIDGVLVVNNDGGKGTFGAGNSVMLTKGLHDIRVDYGQGTGGDDFGMYWQGPGIAKAVIPASNLFTAESSTSTGSSTLVNSGTNISVSGSATLNLNGTNFTGVQLGSLTAPAASTLNVTGEAGKLARMAGTFLSGGTVTLNTTPDLALGQVIDGGVATTIVKQGPGRLILDNTNFAITGLASSLVAGTIIDVQAGKLVAQGYVGGANPLSAAQVRLSGGALLLDSKQGNATFDNALTVAASSLLEVVPAGTTQILGGTNGITLQSNSTLTIDLYGGARTGSVQAQAIGVQGAALTVAGAITGTGNLAFRSTQFDQGMYPVFGSATFTANNTFAGAVTLTGGLGSQGIVTTMALTLNSNGRLSGATGITLNAARLALDDNATLLTGRLNTTTPVPLTLNVGELQIAMSTSTTSSGETIGALTSGVGLNRVVLTNTPGAGATGLLTAASLTRNNRSVIQFQGSAMGGQATAASLVKFTSALSGQLVGGGGAAATSTISILPYAFGASNPGTNPPTYMPVTYDATNGVRPINTGTEITTLAAALANGNTRDSIGAAATPVPTVNAINSWTLDNSANATALTATLTTNPLLFSGTGAGLLLLTASNTTNQASALTITGTAINFQGAEGNIIVTGTSGATISSVIQGSNGITVTGLNHVNSNAQQTTTALGGALTLTADNSAGLTGIITINGTLVLNNGVTDLPLGNAANPVQFGGGTLRFNNAGSTLAATRTVTLLGNTFGVIDTNGNADTIAGPVTGSGGLIKVNTGRLTLSNTVANTNYSGTTTVLQGDLTTNTGPQGNIIISGAVDNIAPASATVSNVTFGQTTSGTYTGNISGIGSVTITANAGNVITFGDPANANVGVNTYAGGTTFGNANAVTLRGTTSSLVGGIVTTAASGQAIVMEQSFNGTANNLISGPATFLKAGNGAITVVNANTYTGATTISAGSLIAATSSPSGAAGAFGNAASAIVLGDAATTTNNSSPGLFTGGAVNVGRAITVANQATTGAYTIGGAADAISTISGAISINQNLRVSQVFTSLTNGLNLTGGISSANAGAKLINFAGPGKIEVSGTGITDGAGVVSTSVTGGITTFSANNTYTGSTSVTGATLQLSGSGQISATSSVAVNTGGTLLLSGGGDRINDLAPMTLNGGTFNTGGFNETLGTLTLTGNSVIDFGGGASILHFADSSGATWTGTLSIWNWSGNQNVGGGTDQLFFGNSSSGLMASQLTQIKFYSDSGSTILPFLPGFSDFTGGLGEVVPVPEPSSVGTVMGLLGLVGWRERRKARAARAAERRAIG